MEMNNFYGMEQGIFLIYISNKNLIFLNINNIFL